MMEIPRPAVTEEQLKKYFTDPEVITLELLFVLMTLSSVFIMYRLMLINIPFPVTVTWFQLVVGFCLAWILGESGRDFPKFAYFPPFHLTMDRMLDLALPTILYLGMITCANVLLANCPNSATYPIILSGAVVAHHASRFWGCGQIYVPLRWISVAIVGLGFLIAACDPGTM
eukprot:Selendium_serpulae@DN8257_c0_g1_i1.p1